MPHQCNIFHIAVFLFYFIDQLIGVAGGFQMFCRDQLALFDIEPIRQYFCRLHCPYCRAAQDQVHLYFHLP